MTEPKTLEQLYRDAIDVQSASNLTGVVHGFSRAMTDLRALFPEEGTNFFNTHPISVLWADKIKSLTGDDFSGAYTEAKKALGEE